MTDTTKYDVAIFGLWWSSNYGSIMTYYSLYRLIEDCGYRAVMIDRPGLKPDDPLFGTDGRRFQKEHFPVTPVFSFEELGRLNEYANCFVMGSDQVWNYWICEKYQGAFFLNFTKKNKKRLSYAASFGHPGFFAPEEAIEETRNYLTRFDAISVRETGAVDIMRETFGIQADRVLDPVFTVDPQIFQDLMKDSAAAKKEDGKPFLLTYILDPTEEKKQAIRYVAEQKQLPMIHMLDGYREHFEANKKKMQMDGIVENLKVEDWLYYLQHCEYFITDSCHGASFAILFGKPFVCIGNPSRGLPRFESLAEIFHLENRFVYDAGEVQKRPDLLETIDYTEAHKILETERARSRKWMQEKLDAPAGNWVRSAYEKPLPLKAALKIYKHLKPFLGEEMKQKIREKVRK